MSEKLKLSLDDLRVETFETTAGPENAAGTVHALDRDECAACSEYTGCSDCTACTRCTWPTCIHTAGDGGPCQPGTAA